MILQIPPRGGHPTLDYITRLAFNDKRTSTSKLMKLHDTPKKADVNYTNFNECDYFRLTCGNNKSPTMTNSTPPVTTTAHVLAIRDSTFMV